MNQRGQFATYLPAFLLSLSAFAFAAGGESFSDIQAKAMSGDAASQTKLGLAYFFGDGIDNSATEAANWYRKAAEQEFAPAQTRLGELYESGNGVSKDYSEALRWYQKATELGDGEAFARLGSMYAGGRGVERNGKKAVTLYQTGVEKLNPDAMLSLGIQYMYGANISRDLTEAYKWFLLARNYAPHTKLSRDLEGAIGGAIDSAKSQLKREEIVSAESLAKEWIQSHSPR